MSAPTIERLVWIAGGHHGTWSPGGYFHQIVGERTGCGLATFGHGSTTSEAEARDDWRQPCGGCYATSHFRATPDRLTLARQVAAGRVYRSGSGSDRLRAPRTRNPIVTRHLRLLADAGWVELGADSRTWRLTDAGHAVVGGGS